MAPGQTVILSQPQPDLLAGDSALAQTRWPFWLLVGFVASQGYLIPVVAVPFLNWAAWPSLPDLFGLGIFLTVILLSRHTRISRFDRDTLKDLFWMGLVLALSFLFVTIPQSVTGEGIKYGAYTLMLFAKMSVVFWATTHIPINQHRIRILHFAALIAFLWLSLTTLGDRLFLIEINNMVSHLPAASAGKWMVGGPYELNSTVSNSHGGTTVTLLVLGALVIGTANYRFAWLTEGMVFVLCAAVGFLTGSRQGLIRMAAFVAIYSARRPGILIMLIWSFLLLWAPFVSTWGNPLSNSDNPYYRDALQRQSILITDPFAAESYSARVDLWKSVIDTLNDVPIRWLSGYGIGNYVEYENSSHNMILQYLQDGGIVVLLYSSLLWLRVFQRIWASRQDSWTLVSLTAAMFTSVFSSTIFYPKLGAGWYLGLLFVIMHILLGDKKRESTNPLYSEPHHMMRNTQYVQRKPAGRASVFSLESVAADHSRSQASFEYRDNKE